MTYETCDVSDENRQSYFITSLTILNTTTKADNKDKIQQDLL